MPTVLSGRCWILRFITLFIGAFLLISSFDMFFTLEGGNFELDLFTILSVLEYADINPISLCK